VKLAILLAWVLALMPVPVAAVTWYEATASYYGPGLYGRKTADGTILTSSTWGVAHRTLPFGTQVTFRYQGNIVTAPVIDRGPYIEGRTFDLTAPVKNALGCPDICHLQYHAGGISSESAPVPQAPPPLEPAALPPTDTIR
jgi:hypothetical protein